MDTVTRKPRTKGQQIVDIIAKMTPKQIEQFAQVWVDREPEHLNRFQRALREMSERDERLEVTEAEA